jgi:hypothetical protein
LPTNQPGRARQRHSLSERQYLGPVFLLCRPLGHADSLLTPRHDQLDQPGAPQRLRIDKTGSYPHYVANSDFRVNRFVAMRMTTRQAVRRNMSL